MTRKKKSKKKDTVNCPYCGTTHKVALDADKIRCKHCDYEIKMGEKAQPTE